MAANSARPGLPTLYPPTSPAIRPFTSGKKKSARLRNTIQIDPMMMDLRRLRLGREVTAPSSWNR
jgi:hypothetical protein